MDFVKQAQAHELLLCACDFSARVRSATNGNQLPLILCGDFNSLPKSSVSNILNYRDEIETNLKDCDS